MANDPIGVCFDANFTNLHSFQACIRDRALAQMRYMSSAQAISFTFIYACISLLGALGNGLVILVVARKREMRTTRNVFIVNLALSNFFLALILVPFLWLPTYRIEFPYGALVCKIAQAFPSTNIFCSTLTISVIAVDRYYVIVRARLGPGYVKTIQAISIVVSIWIVSLALSILYFLYFHTKDYSLPSDLLPEHLMQQANGRDILLFQHCELQPSPCVKMQRERSLLEETKNCFKFHEAALSALTAVFIYFVPMPVLVVFSCLLSRYLANNQLQHSSLRHHVCIPMATAAAGATHPDHRNGSLGAALLTAANTVMGRRPIHTTTCRSAAETSNTTASGRRRSRTTSLLFAMSFSNAILWLPFVIVSLIIQLAPNETTVSFQNELRQLDDVAKLISMLSICVNPFLYGYLNTNFNREFKIILAKFSPCCLQNAFFSNSDRNEAAILSMRAAHRRPGAITMGKACDYDSSNSPTGSNGHHAICAASSKGRVFLADNQGAASQTLLQGLRICSADL